mgnify:CR=1 FL=1
MEAIILVTGITLLILFVWFLVRHSLKVEQNIEQNGIEVDAVVTRVIDTYDRDIHLRRYKTFVKFVGDDNKEHEGRLINVSMSFPYGRKMRVRFLPGEYDCCLFMSQQIDE